MKVLVCDDDTITQRAVEFQFKKDGFEVLKANNGKEGQKILLENNDIVVLITDIYMPQANGLELITFVRETLQSDIPIIVLSRVNIEENILHAYELGVNSYLSKPFKMDELSNSVKLLLNQ